MRFLTMGSEWNVVNPSNPEEDCVAMFCQVDFRKFAMVIIDGPGKGNRWNNPISIGHKAEPGNTRIEVSDAQWDHLTYGDTKLDSNWFVKFEKKE